MQPIDAQTCETDTPGGSADKVHYVNGPGEVLHAFDAEAAEELSVYAGEQVRRITNLPSVCTYAVCSPDVRVLPEREVDGWLHCVMARSHSSTHSEC